MDVPGTDGAYRGAGRGQRVRGEDHLVTVLVALALPWDLNVGQVPGVGGRFHGAGNRFCAAPFG